MTRVALEGMPSSININFSKLYDNPYILRRDSGAVPRYKRLRTENSVALLQQEPEGGDVWQDS